MLSTPETEYQILLESLLQTPAVVEVFFDGHGALCPPRQTRLLRSMLRVRGFEKRRVDLERWDGTLLLKKALSSRPSFSPCLRLKKIEILHNSNPAPSWRIQAYILIESSGDAL